LELKIIKIIKKEHLLNLKCKYHQNHKKEEPFEDKRNKKASRKIEKHGRIKGKKKKQK
jgi:hypothetical protein